mgnify:CR=1 FL=1
MTQEKSKQTECQTLIFCVQDFLARHSLSPESGEDLQMPEELCSSRLPDWLQTSDLRISSLKMFPDCFRMTKAGRFTPSSVRYLSWGTVWNGKCLTARILESPNPESGCILSDILIEDVPEKILPFPTANGTPLVQVQTGRQGKRIYKAEGLSCTLTSGAGGVGGKTGLYEVGIPIKENTKQGYKMAYPRDSIDLGYAGMNTRRGRVGHQIAHTLTTGIQQGTLHFVDLSPPPLITEHCRCLNTRQSGIHNHKGECSGVLKEEGARAVLTPGREETRQNGRRMKEPEEPMFTITATDRHGVAYRGRIRKLVPRECLRLQGFYDWQIDRTEQDTSDSQLYKQAGNGVTVNVIEAIGTLLRQADAEIRARGMKRQRGKAVWQLEFRISTSVQKLK